LLVFIPALGAVAAGRDPPGSKAGHQPSHPAATGTMTPAVTFPQAASSFASERGWMVQQPRRCTVSTRQEQNTAAFPETETGGGPAPAPRPPAPSAARNAIHFGPRTRRLIRAVARVVNPLVLRIAGRRHMPILGVVHHRGRVTGRRYATPLGVRPTADGGFVIPLTFSQASQWYQNIGAAGCCIITYRGVDRTVADPAVVDRAAAGPAYPGYERLALRLIGINEFVSLTGLPAGTTAPAA
jgi:deazaflavin-dependent oxidoreductase (nitroreductase family)